MSTLSICIPTCLRPEMIDRLLENLVSQTLPPDDIVIVDASPDTRTREVVEKWQQQYPPNLLRWIPGERGLTRQRNVGIDNITCDLIGMLDDDVVLEPDCLAEVKKFLDSEEGRNFGGAGMYITNEYGQNYYSYERLYHRLGIYETLEPGHWLYCGDFIQLSRLKPFEGVFKTDFCPGCGAVYRRAVAQEIRPDSSFHFGGEDKHWGLRISQKYALGIVGTARLRHDRVPGGARKSPFRQSIRNIRNRAIMLRGCDSNPSWRRYVVYLTYQFAELTRKMVLVTCRRRWALYRPLTGEWIGWLWNMVQPPTRSK